MKWMFAAFLLLSSVSIAEEPLSLEAALGAAYAKFPRLAAQKDRMRAAESEVLSRATPSSPNVGVSQLNRGNSTLYATIEQKIDFPTKYFLKAKAQGYRADAEESDYEALRLHVRSNVITAYYGLHAVQQIIDLNQQDLSRLKEISRVTESKYASGKAPQHDQMKAHVAQTETETKLIALRQEEQALQAKLGYFIAAGPDFQTNLRGRELSVPDVRSELEKIKLSDMAESPTIAKTKALTRAAETESSLTGWNFAPDFKVMYQHRVAGAPDNSHILGVSMTIPLWFWGNSSDSIAASARASAARKELANAESQVAADLRTLKYTLASDYELYEIFRSSLIPQALSSYNSAMAAYRANRISFNDYLDSERSLLKVKIARLRTRSEYIANLVRFESMLGKVLSSLGQLSHATKEAK